MADFPIAALRSVELSTPDLAASIDFYTRAWGLEVVAETGDKAFLAASGDDFHVLELMADERCELRKISFRTRSANDLVALFEKTQAAGCAVLCGLGPADAPCRGDRFVVRQSQGAAMEFLHGDLRKQAVEVASRPARLAHVNINSADIEALSAFYQDVLGFRLTDRSRLMAFLRCNNDHHAVVLAEAPVNGLNHIAFLMPDLESVMRGSGRVVDQGYPIGWGVGRHGPGDNVFSYFVDPQGVVVEYTAEVLQVDDGYRVKGPSDWIWPPGRTDHWGIAPPKSEACKGHSYPSDFTAIDFDLGGGAFLVSEASDTFSRFDVVVVGFGPAGAVAAGMLGQRGHSTLVVDRQSGIYDKPRAIAIDHEILRQFDNMGIANDLLPHIEPFTASQHFGAQGQLIRRIDMVPPPYPLGYTPSMVFTQPPVEAVLRRHAGSFDCVTVELGTEMTGLVQRTDEVVIELRDSSGKVRSVAAKYVIGCDGASSRVRELSGFKLEDLVFDEPWLVVDVLAHDDALARLPQTSAQFCNPARPTSYIMGPKNHRRWEIMLLPEEDPREFEKPENVWRLLSPWLSQDEGEIWRAAAYRFHALVADEWRRGRAIVAGDAAHQQPPFIGQGMCQGLRDVSNLVWKLDRVLNGRSSEDLLDTYTVERRRHVQTLTSKIKAIGQTICERDPVAAALRDARILAEGGGQPVTITRQDIVPPLEEGLIALEGSPGRGVLFPQPAIVEGATSRLLDGMVAPGWRLVLDGRSVDAADAASLAAGLADLAVVVIGSESAPGRLCEKDGVVAAWFDRFGAVAALVRPDHYVFGATRDLDSLGAQIDDLRARLA